MIVVDESIVARFGASALAAKGEPLVLLGRAVAKAFGLDFLPYSIACGATLMAVLPKARNPVRTDACLRELREIHEAAKAAAS